MFAAFAICLLGAGQAFAIPSPELVVGSFVSISQLLALMSAVLGGGAVFATMRARKRGGSAQMSRALLYTAGGLFVAMTISIGVNIWQYVGQVNERQARLENTLLRPSRAPAGLPDDPDAKEINFTQQLKHPLRISTEETAKLLAAMGFEALASTSSGAAWAQGKQDGELTLEEVLAHLEILCEATGCDRGFLVFHDLENEDGLTFESNDFRHEVGEGFQPKR